MVARYSERRQQLYRLQVTALQERRLTHAHIANKVIKAAKIANEINQIVQATLLTNKLMLVEQRWRTYDTQALFGQML